MKLGSRRSWVASLEGIWLSLRRLPITIVEAMPWMRKAKGGLPSLINEEKAAQLLIADEAARPRYAAEDRRADGTVVRP